MGFTSWANTVTGRLIGLSGDATVQGRERDRAKWWLVGLCNVIGYRERGNQIEGEENKFEGV
jgi:hypothetical protein